MRILNINKFFYLRGGAERYFFELTRLLESHGHTVASFAMSDAKNEPSPYGKFFVSRVDFENPRGLERLRAFGRMMYSFEAKKKIKALIKEFKPDIAHVHNIYHQISPSVLDALREAGVPVVMTAHDYKLVSPNYNRFHDGAVCDHAFGRRFFRAARFRCVKNSFLASLADALEMTLHTKLGLYEKNISKILAPSAHLKRALVKWGIDEKKIVHLPLFIPLEAEYPASAGSNIPRELLTGFIDFAKYVPNYSDRGYVLFVGRLAQEKGAQVLIRAAGLLPHIPFKIVGDGPDAVGLRKEAAMLKNIEFLGAFGGDKLREMLANARFVVVPSLAEEVAPMVILEAFASGKTVVGSRIGGIPEMVEEKQTGILVPSGDEKQLVDSINELYSQPEAARLMGQAGRKMVEERYSPESHYKALMEIYKLAL